MRLLKSLITIAFFSSFLSAAGSSKPVLAPEHKVFASLSANILKKGISPQHCVNKIYFKRKSRGTSVNSTLLPERDFSVACFFAKPGLVEMNSFNLLKEYYSNNKRGPPFI